MKHMFMKHLNTFFGCIHLGGSRSLRRRLSSSSGVSLRYKIIRIREYSTYWNKSNNSYSPDKDSYTFVGQTLIPVGEYQAY